MGAIEIRDFDLRRVVRGQGKVGDTKECDLGGKKLL